MPYLHTSVVYNEEKGEVAVFAVNRSLDEDMELTVIGIVTAVLSILIMNRMDVSELNHPTVKGGVAVRRQSAARYVYIVWAVVLAWLLLLMGDGASAFIYFQF